MKVIEIRGKKSFAGPGVWGYDAEARVITENEETVYVHVNEYESRHYTVSKTSIYDFMTGDGEFEEPKYEEEYERLSDAKKSAYGKVFDTLAKVISRLEKGTD